MSPTQNIKSIQTHPRLEFLPSSAILPIIFFLLCLLFLVQQNPCLAVLQIGVNKGHFEPMPIAIQAFSPVNSESKEMSEAITKIITNDLESSGLFRSMDHESFLETVKFDSRPNFANWRKIRATALLLGKIEIMPREQMVKVMFRLWDIYGERQLEAMVYKIKYTSWRRLGHKVADKVYAKITGDGGYFDSRVVYIAETGTGKQRKKRLAIMDQDGANLRYLSDGKTIVITPRFDPKNNRIAYMSYHRHTPQVFVIDIATGIKSKIGEFQGMSFAPRFSPDGYAMAMSIAKNGSTSIYEVEITRGISGAIRRLTRDNGTISTSPSYSPDSQQIVYCSDKNGRPQLYVMNRDGSDSHRISMGDGSYSTPVWSPRGDYIAFTKMSKGQFFIGVIRPDGSEERMVTSSWLEEGPSWAPNGRAIIFTRQDRGGSSRLCSIDITGYGERIVKTETAASDPAWSPLLP